MPSASTAWRRIHLALIAVTAAVVASGCVTQSTVSGSADVPPPRNASDPPSDDESPPTEPVEADEAPVAPARDTIVEIDADEPDSSAPSPAPQPAPETASRPEDLWAIIRSGFGMQSHADQARVRRWTQYFATHQRGLKSSLASAQPYLWHVVQRIDARDMPMELALLPVVESGYDPSARSYMGATGLWQFMPRTADHMGLARDWWYDERNDVIASTEAALAYLERLNARYDGDWLLALAAYNAGPGRVDNARARAHSKGLAGHYWQLELPLETMDYVPKLLALRRILATPNRFGMEWPSLENTPRTAAVELPSQIELSVAANMLDMSEPALRRLNPAMRRWASAPRNDTRLLVPAGKADRFRKLLAAAEPASLIRRNTYTVRRGDALSRIAQSYGVSVAALRQANNLRSDRIRVGQSLDIPRDQGAPERPSAEPSETYVVQAGDSLWEIAQRYNVDVAAMRRSNPDVSSSIRPGQNLSIPGSASPPEPSVHVVERGDSLWQIASANKITVAELRRWNRLGRNARLQPGQTLAIDGPAPLPDFYEVEAGDSLWSIANRFSMQVTTLRSLNDMSSGSTIQPGQRLRLQPTVSSS